MIDLTHEPPHVFLTQFTDEQVIACYIDTATANTLADIAEEHSPILNGVLDWYHNDGSTVLQWLCLQLEEYLFDYDGEKHSLKRPRPAPSWTVVLRP